MTDKTKDIVIQDLVTVLKAMKDYTDLSDHFGAKVYRQIEDALQAAEDLEDADRVDISLGGGKYHIVYDPAEGDYDLKFHCYRNGDKWQTFTGNKMMYLLVWLTHDLQHLSNQIRATMDGPASDQSKLIEIARIMATAEANNEDIWS